MALALRTQVRVTVDACPVPASALAFLHRDDVVGLGRSRWAFIADWMGRKVFQTPTWPACPHTVATGARGTAFAFTGEGMSGAIASVMGRTWTCRHTTRTLGMRRHRAAMNMRVLRSDVEVLLLRCSEMVGRDR